MLHRQGSALILLYHCFRVGVEELEQLLLLLDLSEEQAIVRVVPNSLEFVSRLDSDITPASEGRQALSRQIWNVAQFN